MSSFLSISWVKESRNLVSFVFYFSTQNQVKISNQNKLRNGPGIKILCNNLKKQALFIFYTIFQSQFSK